jgi:uncharacterized protein YfaS (alpha-2-macroglobulin family)
LIPAIFVGVVGQSSDQAPRVHTVHFAVTKDVAPSSKIRLVVNTENLREIHLSVTRIDAVKWLTFESPKNIAPNSSRAPLRKWELRIAQKDGPPNPNQADSYYYRQINLPPLSPGVYLLRSSDGDKPAWAVVNVTDLAVVVKRSPEHALVWVTDFKSGRVIPNASVSYYRSNGQRVKTVETKSDGATLFSLPPSEGTILVSRRKDVAGIPSSQGDPDGRLVAHFQTDRPIYRPGQSVSFKALLRRTFGQGYSVSSGKMCTVQLRDPKDNPIDELRLTSTSMGSVAGTFSIPSEAMTGAYSLVLTTGPDTAYQSITVAEYRKPEFKVEVHPLKKRLLAGEELVFELDAGYFFGAPTPGAQVRYTVRRSNMSFWGADSTSGAFYSGDGNLYPQDTYRANPFVASDTAFTDSNGKLLIRVKTDKDAPDSTYDIECTVTDSARRQVDGGASEPVYSANIRVGLASTLQWASLGSLAPVRIRVADLDGAPKAARVELEIKKPVYDDKTGEYREVLVTRTSVSVPASGVYTIQLPAKEAGELRIYARAKDDTGRFAKALMGIYVEGDYQAPAKEVEQPKVEVRLDRREYAKGDNAKAMVTTNHPHTPVLEVLEGGDIWNYRVLSDPNRVETWTFPIDLKLSPNAYVSGEQWVKGNLVSANAMLPVPDRSKQLQVAITSDKQSYEPGDQATYKIHTTDRNGKPVQTEIALAVVDEAIFALSADSTDDLYRLYWGLRPDAVSLAASAPEELSGGAYQRISAIAPVRQRFVDTAYWAPSVLTDAQGNASVSFEMPGNLTAWRATGRAVTAATAVGTGVEIVQASRPVTLRLATPRQMVVGDRLTLIGNVVNRSKIPHTFEVRIDANGLDLNDGNTKRLTLKAKSEGKVQWEIEARKMPPSGQVTLSGQVEATDDPVPDNSDALRVSFPIVPDGLPEQIDRSGSVTHDARALLMLPTDRLEPATLVQVTVWTGFKPAMMAAANDVLNSPRYGSVGATNQLQVAAILGLSRHDDHVRESLALLSRTQKNDGWGWWDNSPADPLITAHTLSVLAEAKMEGMQIYDSLLNPAKEAAVNRYNATNLWEHRAILATASVLAGDSRGSTEIDEVLERGQSISPFAKIRLARGLFALHKTARSNQLVDEALANASQGASETFIPGGEGIGWSATDLETTAEALNLMARMNIDENIQSKLARWLVSSNTESMSLQDQAELVSALNQYLRHHRESEKLGQVEVECNGQSFTAKPDPFGQSAVAKIALSALVSGPNHIEIQKSSDGEALFTVTATVFHPVNQESVHGIRILRRFEVKNSGGVWVELNRTIHPGEAVRCSTVEWGDDLDDAVKVTDPLPAGFEYIQDGDESDGYQEVRDGAVLNFVLNSGLPRTFRYFIRAESEGELVCLPATAEYLRRPWAHGNTNPGKLLVEETAK